MSIYAEGDIVYWTTEWVDYSWEITGMYLKEYQISTEEQYRRASLDEPAYIVVAKNDNKKYIVDHTLLDPETSWKENALSDK